MCACVHMFVGWWTCVSVDVECVCVFSGMFSEGMLCYGL